jgi:penicillin amidase
MSSHDRPLAGASGPIELGRDEHGVASIRARSRDDAIRGLGYCHARDRGLQMLFVRILGRGWGSRWFEASDRMLAIDRYFRRCNFIADADVEHESLAPSVRTAADAYVEGVNAYFGASGLPWELKALGYHKAFQPWTFADCVVTGKVIGFVSLGSTQGEIERWIIESARAGVPIAALEEMFPGALGGLDLDLIRRLNLTESVVPEELWSVAGMPWAAASNSWVVDGSRSASGKPILCNDPHLEINRIPPVWYEAVMRWESHYAMGATMPGAPGVVIGRNDRVSWGVTYSYMDCVDSWIEDCRDGLYRRGDDWKPLRLREETIERKGKPSETVRFYETEEHGTLAGDPTEPGLYLSTRWSCGERTAAASIGALVKMMDATTADEGRAILAGLSNSAWVLVLADVDGSIAMQMSGQMPLRPEEVSGLVPLPGWEPENDWRGFAAFEDLPRQLNPTDGVIVAANNDLNSLGRLYPIKLSVSPYRAERIRSMIESHVGKLTIDDMSVIQRDLKSTQAAQFMELIHPLLDERRSDARAESLRRWDLKYQVGSLGATLFERIYAALYDEVFGKALGRPALAHLRKRTILLVEFYHIFDRILLAEHSLWFFGRSRSDIFRAAIRTALAEDPEPYRSAEPVRFNHILLGGKLPLFLGFDRGPYDLDGGRATVSQCQVGEIVGRESAGCPSYRLIADMASNQIETALPGGPSDRRFSRWYASELNRFLAGKMKTLRPED